MKITYDSQIFRFRVYGGIPRYFVKFTQKVACEEQVVVSAFLHVKNYEGSSRYHRESLDTCEAAIGGYSSVQLILNTPCERYMKILFDHQIFALQKYGSVSRHFYEIANRIAEILGNEVEIFAPLYQTEYFDKNCSVRPRGIKVPSSGILQRIVGVVIRGTACAIETTA
jgi:hypothetical protein